MGLGACGKGCGTDAGPAPAGQGAHVALRCRPRLGRRLRMPIGYIFHAKSSNFGVVSSWVGVLSFLRSTRAGLPSFGRSLHAAPTAVERSAAKSRPLHEQSGHVQDRWSRGGLSVMPAHRGRGPNDRSHAPCDRPPAPSNRCPVPCNRRPVRVLGFYWRVIDFWRRGTDFYQRVIDV